VVGVKNVWMIYCLTVWRSPLIFVPCWWAWKRILYWKVASISVCV
jgi:hypothetical protein